MGANRLIRQGAARRAMLEHRASVATPPRGRFAPPQAGFFCAVASLHPFADALHRHAARAEYLLS